MKIVKCGQFQQVRNKTVRTRSQVTIEEEMICETLQMLNSDIQESEELLEEGTSDEIALSPIRETGSELGSPSRNKGLMRSLTIGDFDTDQLPTIISMPSMNNTNGEQEE